MKTFVVCIPTDFCTGFLSLKKVIDLKKILSRSMAVTSLEDFVGFMKTYASGNDFTRNGGKGEYHEGQFLQPPMLRIRLESY